MFHVRTEQAKFFLGLAKSTFKWCLSLLNLALCNLEVFATVFLVGRLHEHHFDTILVDVVRYHAASFSVLFFGRHLGLFLNNKPIFIQRHGDQFVFYYSRSYFSTTHKYYYGTQTPHCQSRD